MHTSTRTYIHTYTCMYADVYIDTHQKNCFNYKTVVADKLLEGGIKGTRGKKKIKKTLASGKDELKHSTLVLCAQTDPRPMGEPLSTLQV